MPGLTTHTYILYKALSTFESKSSLFERIIKSNAVAVKYAKKDQHAEYLNDPLCIGAGAAYLGSCGPDLFYLEFGEVGAFVADLMHYNKPGLYMIWCLRDIKRLKSEIVAMKREDLLPRFAYCLGHISHIAADITVHPYVNSIVEAYPDNIKVFENNRGWFTRGLMRDFNQSKVWAFHNVLEQYQDAYVLHRRFFGMEKFAEDWNNVNIARAAAAYYLKEENQDEWFLVHNAKNFYKFDRQYDTGLEEDKYRVFENSNWILDISGYYENALPSESTMNSCPQLVQGGTYNKNGEMEKPGLFDIYIDDAVAQTHAFWREVENYLEDEQEPDNYDDSQMEFEKLYFRSLRRHWNLDTGLAPSIDSNMLIWRIPTADNAILNVVGTIEYTSAQTGPKFDRRDD